VVGNAEGAGVGIFDGAGVGLVEGCDEGFDEGCPDGRFENGEVVTDGDAVLEVEAVGAAVGERLTTVGAETPLKE
jgi:hypothetical protein